MPRKTQSDITCHITVHSRIANQEWIRHNLEIPFELRRELVNMPIHSSLMPTVLEFIFSESYEDSLPPLLKSSTDPIPKSHLENAAALLDGACSIHCAALRGNPSQVDHLLYSGADPTIKTASGDLALQLIPVCRDADPPSKESMCRCLNPKDQEVWECRSSSARLLMIRRCISSVHLGLTSWFMLMILCILNFLGIWGNDFDVCNRSSILRHAEHQLEVKMTKACLESKRLMNEMRKEARLGQHHLEAARALPWRDDKHRRTDNDDTEKAFLSFVHAVHFLQNLLLHNEGKDYAAAPDVAPAPLSKVTAPDCQVAEDEQADLYCCWAESVLLKFQSCRCAGCAAVAMSAIRMAHVRCADLLTRTQRSYPKSSEKQQSVGTDLMHVVYSHICLLLDTDARRSATKASMWRADQCIKEWRRLETRHFGFQGYDSGRVALLERWVKAAESDLLLAEALYGDLLEPSQTVDQIIDITVARGPKGMRYLHHQTALENVEILETALQKAKSASPYLHSLTEEVMQNAKDEMNAAIKLKECLSSKVAPLTSGTTEKLSEAIAEAERFPRLTVDVDAGRQLYRQLSKRAEAIERLETIMYRSRQPIPLDAQSDVDTQIIHDRIEALKMGIEEAKGARINTEKARKLLRDLEALLTVVDAAHLLDTVMSKKPCGTATLKAALMRAEGCNAAGIQSGGLVAMSQFLLPRIQAARKRMEIERVVENLNRATVTYTTVDDLSKLESIILDARKLFDRVGAEESDQIAYTAARSLRGTLHDASKVRQQLQSNAATLQKHQRKVDAVALEATIAQAHSCWSLIEDDAVKAQATLNQWKSIQASEERLNQAIKESETATRLAKAVHDAMAVGVKTQSAKKVLKLMQNVEQTVEGITHRTIEHQTFKRNIEEAKQGGVCEIFISKACILFRNALASRAQELLDGALDDDGEDVEHRCKKLKMALEQSMTVMQCCQSSPEVSHEGPLKKGEPFWNALLQQDPSSKTLRTLKESADRVGDGVRLCETEILKRKTEEEERIQKAKDLERQQQLLMQQMIESEQKERERLRREREETARKEERLREQQRQTMEHRLQRSLEKQEQEKRSGTFRCRLVDPLTNETLAPSTAPTVRSFQPADESMKEMENQVRRLLEDDSSENVSQSRCMENAHPLEDANLRVKGVLERLDDPWGVQSTATAPMEPFDVPEMPPMGHLSMDYMFVRHTDPFEALLARKRALDSMQAMENLGFRFAKTTQGMMTMPHWPRPVSSGLVSRRSMPLDSSAPAFYPSISADPKDYTQGMNVFTSDPLASPQKSPIWSASALGAEDGFIMPMSRSPVCPFPGVGAGIPGATSPPMRSLSEGLTRFRQSSLTKTERDAYSMSGEF